MARFFVLRRGVGEEAPNPYIITGLRLLGNLNPLGYLLIKEKEERQGDES
jgi:hypothetical protein